METPEQQQLEKELEKFIHQQLQKLPEHDAPESLAANVLRAIAARENLPWWKQPFTAWPRNSQSLLLFALLAAFAGLIYAAWKPSEAITLAALAERASAFSWIASAIETLFGGAWIVIRKVSYFWLGAIAAVAFLMYAACLTTGFALYRVAVPRQEQAA